MWAEHTAVFQAWVNYYLPPDSAIDNLFVDLQDGTRLAELLTVLQQDVPELAMFKFKVRQKPKTFFERMSNLEQCFNFLQVSKCRTPRCSPKDIHEGDPAFTLDWRRSASALRPAGCRGTR